MQPVSIQLHPSPYPLNTCIWRSSEGADKYGNKHHPHFCAFTANISPEPLTVLIIFRNRMEGMDKRLPPSPGPLSGREAEGRLPASPPPSRSADSDRGGIIPPPALLCTALLYLYSTPPHQRGSSVISPVRRSGISAHSEHHSEVLCEQHRR